ncbi:hypothetical protein WQE_23483 [Paraburkholderia hospita]|uniref:Uncharacterized protein n=2 Tax=Paraburkholderia hospita TaxID=169430 RepID=A0ABN0FII5_9BURK|nr:hypothetical protein [Paraburkholderia hospita]EIM98543.1 hypothetical protein WQE_23483 [Paraburkholderia hospita]OUL86631.1 hypothetical protein CA602_15480 [Paraburkholderia hospita]
MKKYFHETFPQDLSRIRLKRANRIVEREILKDERSAFFGGQAWANVSADLSVIPQARHLNFVLSLFMITLTDQCLYTYRQDLYPEWRRQTAFPKFGWTGFGVHNENPFYLLWAPEREDLINRNDAVEQMPQFVDFLIDETTRYFEVCGFDLDISDYLNVIRNDAAYAFNEGIVVPCFKQAFALAIATMNR